MKAGTDKKSKSNSKFLVDGRSRAYAAIEPQVRAELEQEFREQLESASWVRRCLIRQEMARELRRRIERLAPRDALY